MARKKMSKEEKDVRIVQLVAREGMLSKMLDEGAFLDQGEFPTANHRAIITLIYKETLQEMSKLGLTPYEI